MGEQTVEFFKSANPEDEYFFEEGCFILELSNSVDDPEASIARARVEPGVTTRLHRLVGITERYVILEGRGVVRLGEVPAREVGAGEVVVIPPLCPQQIKNTGSSDLVFLAVCTPRFRREAYQDIDASPSEGRVYTSSIGDEGGKR
jgi:mannose-6-phosphate isomerase-like protein (cupin superfamily)